MKRIVTAVLLLACIAALRSDAQPMSAMTLVDSHADTITQSNHSCGTIKGNLKDHLGNPVVAAIVECINDADSLSYSITDFDGNYTIPSLPAGKRNIQFRFQGKELTITDIPLAEGTLRIVDGTITAGPVTLGRRHSCRIICPPIIDPSYPGGHVTYSKDMLW